MARVKLPLEMANGVMARTIEDLRGQRFDTYVIAGERGSRIICVNGAAARLVAVGDHVIIMAYKLIEEKDAPNHKPTVVFLDSDNNPCEEKECKRTVGK